MKEEVAGDWRKLHNEKLHNLYASSNIVMEIKSRRMKLVVDVARMLEKRN
jgi:antitoxin component HigA of HigAB toxin-antitoxin module